MTPRRLTDAQVAAGLRAHLPVAHAGLSERILAEITTTPQERRHLLMLGILTDADPMARRRVTLLVALIALALTVAFTAIAGSLLREMQAPELSLDPPTDLPAFVRSAYDDMPALEPMTITALRDETTKIRISVDASGATRIDEFATTDATEPRSYQLFAGTTKAELKDAGSRRVWYQQTNAIFEDPRVFVFAALGAARGGPAPGCEVAVTPGEQYSGEPGRNWRYVALEYVAGRPAHHVRCTDDLWIDVATRLTLKSQAATGAGSTRTIEVTSVEVGQPSPELFHIRPPQGVAAITPQEFQEVECSLDLVCSASPAPATTPPPAGVELARDGDAIVAAATQAADELGAFDAVVEHAGATVPTRWDRVVADGSGRFRVERWYASSPERTIELISPDHHYATEPLTDGTMIWREGKRLTQRQLPTSPIPLPSACDGSWDVIGVDEIHGRVADHIRCSASGSSDYWIDRETHLAVRVFSTPDPASGWETSEVTRLRLGESDAELFELPPDASLDPSTSEAAKGVPGWPDTSENAAGVYSWDASTCSSTWCSMGFMHNGYGSGDVEIRIRGIPLGTGTGSGDGATAVKIAGRDGFYRRIDPGSEQWVVDIDRTTIFIDLTARPGVSPADLAEAHGIIESLRTEAWDNALGFMLVFTLTTDDWDSG